MGEREYFLGVPRAGTKAQGAPCSTDGRCYQFDDVPDGA